MNSNDINRISQARKEALKRAYNISGGSPVMMFVDNQLFEGFPITLSKGECQAVIDYLRSKGYIEPKTKDGYYTLEPEGIDYIEQTIIDEDSFSQNQLNALDEKLDHIIKELKKLSVGQELIFDEIDELKIKSRKFSKSDFEKLVIGSFITFAAKRIITSDKANELYKYLFENNGMLLP